MIHWCHRLQNIILLLIHITYALACVRIQSTKKRISQQATALDGVFLENIVIDVQNYSLKYHDDVIKWKHFPRYWPSVRGIHRSPVNSPHKGLWRGALMFSLICVWINGWVNNREAGDLRRNLAHYDVTVIYCFNISEIIIQSGHIRTDVPYIIALSILPFKFQKPELKSRAFY